MSRSPADEKRRKVRSSVDPPTKLAPGTRNSIQPMKMPSDAYRLFQHCLGELDSDPGDVYFHLGWCLEQIRVGDRQEALAYYQLAGELASTPECRINGMFRAAWLLMHEKR